MRKRIPAIHSRRMESKSLKDLQMQIEVANQYPDLQFDLSKLEKFFEHVCSVHQHNLSGELSIVFMTRPTHSELHGKYLHDYRPTDVITFPPDQKNGLVGEICVSVDQAVDEAENRRVHFEEELNLYLVHGWLHLIGFDDLEKVDRQVMRLEEQKVLEFVKKHDAWPDFRLAPSTTRE